METTRSPQIAIRLANADDRSALIRLAALDSGPAPIGKALVADRDGEIVAAHPLAGRRPIADPFARTSDLTELLALRASQLSPSSSARPRQYLPGFLTRRRAVRSRAALRVAQ